MKAEASSELSKGRVMDVPAACMVFAISGLLSSVGAVAYALGKKDCTPTGAARLALYGAVFGTGASMVGWGWWGDTEAGRYFLIGGCALLSLGGPVTALSGLLKQAILRMLANGHGGKPFPPRRGPRIEPDSDVQV